MALFNEILAGRYNRALQKLFSMKGEAPAPQLGGEIIPTIQIFYGVENRYLEGWDRFGFESSLAANGVGLFNAARLRNPLTSGTIAVIERLAFSSPVADSPVFEHGILATDYVALGNMANTRWDPRGRPTPTLIESTTAGGTVAVAFGSVAHAPNIPANTCYEFIIYEGMQIPLLPGDGIQLRSNVANQGNQFIFWWRERPLEDSEKT